MADFNTQEILFGRGFAAVSFKDKMYTIVGFILLLVLYGLGLGLSGTSTDSRAFRITLVALGLSAIIFSPAMYRLVYSLTSKVSSGLGGILIGENGEPSWSAFGLHALVFTFIMWMSSYGVMGW